jgi:hypothetical protein
MNNLENRRWFQWVVGERKGEILPFDKIQSEDGNIYICFKDGSRINEEFVAPLNERNLSGKFMAEIDGPHNCWKFQERKIDTTPRVEQDAQSGERFEVPTADEMAQAELTGETGVIKQTGPKNKIIDLIPPRPSPKTSSSFGTVTNIQPTVVYVENPVKTESKIDSTDPVFILMSKAKKNDSEISMNITVSLPPKNLYDIAKESFDAGDKKFVEYIIQNITVDEIKEALKVAITEMYEKQSGLVI